MINFQPAEQTNLPSQTNASENSSGLWQTKRKHPVDSTYKEYSKQQKVNDPVKNQMKLLKMEKIIEDLELKNKSLYSKCAKIINTNKSLVEANLSLEKDLKNLTDNVKENEQINASFEYSVKTWDKYPSGVLNTEMLAAMWKEVSAVTIPICQCVKKPKKPANSNIH